MKKHILYLLYFTLIITSSCKKEPELMVNATAYVNSKYAIANFAILDASQSEIIKNENTLATYFNSHPARAKFGVHQYSQYLKPGSYIIAIQLTEGNIGFKEKTYTYKNVTTKNGTPSMDNIMEFISPWTGYYNAWVDKSY